MTVKELIEVSPYCDTAEIIIREHGHGRWLQGFRIGKMVKIYPCDKCTEYRKKLAKDDQRGWIYLDKGVEVDVEVCRDLPMKVICKDVSKIPEHIANLQICSAQPRHIPQYHKDGLTHNDFAFEIDCYPDGFVMPTEEKREKKEEQLEGQTSIEDFLEVCV
jgi:hypothetical protein